MRDIIKFVLLFSGAFFLFIGFMFSFVVGIGLLLDSSEPQKESFEHKITYTAELKSNSTVENATFLLPYPEDERFRKSVKSNSSNVSIHNDWNATISEVNSSRGQMLEASIETFEPETSIEKIEEEIDESDIENDTDIRRKMKEGEANNTDFNDYLSYNLVIDVEYNDSIETKEGLELGPHLQSNRSLDSGCGTFEENCFNSSIEAFLDYETENDTAVDLSLSLEGRNSWWNLGWSGNSYSQDFYTGFYDDSKIIGPQDDWVKLEGRERQAQGSYRR